MYMYLSSADICLSSSVELNAVAIGVLERLSVSLSLLQAEQRHAELKKLGLDGKIVLIGKKGITYFNRRTGKYDIVGEPPKEDFPVFEVCM